MNKKTHLSEKALAAIRRITGSTFVGDDIVDEGRSLRWTYFVVIEQSLPYSLEAKIGLSTYEEVEEVPQGTTGYLWWKKELPPREIVHRGIEFEYKGQTVYNPDVKLDEEPLVRFKYRVVVGDLGEGLGLYLQHCDFYSAVLLTDGRDFDLGLDDEEYLESVLRSERGIETGKKLLGLRKIQWGADVLVVLPEELQEIVSKGYVILES